MAADSHTTQTRTTTHWQRFSVPYEFPVVFTEGVFDPENLMNPGKVVPLP